MSSLGIDGSAEGTVLKTLSRSQIEKRRRNIPNALNNPGCMRRHAPLFYIDNETGQKCEISFVTDKNVRGGHTRFQTKQDGLIALGIMLRERFDNQTIDQIMRVYAPTSDGNNTSKYIQSLKREMKKQLGSQFNPSQPLDLDDPRVLKTLMKGIATYEGALVGIDYTDDMFDKAVQCQPLSRDRLAKRRVRSGKLATRRVSDAQRQEFEERRRLISAQASVAPTEASIDRTDTAYACAHARLFGQVYGGVRGKTLYSLAEIGKMSQGVQNLMDAKLLPAGDVERQSTILLYKLQQANLLTDGAMRVVVDGKRVRFSDYLKKNGGLPLNQVSEKLNADNLSPEEQRQLAVTLLCIDSAITERGGIARKIKSPNFSGMGSANMTLSMNQEAGRQSGRTVSRTQGRC